MDQRTMPRNLTPNKKLMWSRKILWKLDKEQHVLQPNKLMNAGGLACMNWKTIELKELNL